MVVLTFNLDVKYKYLLECKPINKGLFNEEPCMIVHQSAPLPTCECNDCECTATKRPTFNFACTVISQPHFMSRVRGMIMKAEALLFMA